MSKFPQVLAALVTSAAALDPGIATAREPGRTATESEAPKASDDTADGSRSAKVQPERPPRASADAPGVSRKRTVAVRRPVEPSQQNQATRPGEFPKFAVLLERIENRTAESDPQVAVVLRKATNNEVTALEGVRLLESGADVPELGARGVSVFSLDASIVELSHESRDGEARFSARIEYAIRKVPEQTLKGTMTGAAYALTDQKRAADPNERAQFFRDALEAAVQSAMRTVTPVLESMTEPPAIKASRQRVARAK